MRFLDLVCVLEGFVGLVGTGSFVSCKRLFSTKEVIDRMAIDEITATGGVVAFVAWPAKEVEE